MWSVSKRLEWASEVPIQQAQMSAGRFSVLKQTSTRSAALYGGFIDEEGRERGVGSVGDPRLHMLPQLKDLKWVDQFPYFPAYRYHPYRSYCGACSSMLFLTIMLLRVITSISDYIDRPPIVTEAREQFPRDSAQQYKLPRVGVQFRQNGWKPFHDPRYLSFVFEQGVITTSGNVNTQRSPCFKALLANHPCYQRTKHYAPGELYESR